MSSCGKPSRNDVRIVIFSTRWRTCTQRHPFSEIKYRLGADVASASVPVIVMIEAASDMPSSYLPVFLGCFIPGKPGMYLIYPILVLLLKNPAVAALYALELHRSRLNQI